MIQVGMIFLWVSYAAIYVGMYRISGDKRVVQAIFMGQS